MRITPFNRLENNARPTRPNRVSGTLSWARDYSVRRRRRRHGSHDLRLKSVTAARDTEDLTVTERLPAALSFANCAQALERGARVIVELGQQR